MADIKYFGLRAAPDAPYTGLVAMEFRASTGEKIDGLYIFQMQKDGWHLDDGTGADAISGGGGLTHTMPLTIDQAEQVAAEQFGRKIYDYA